MITVKGRDLIIPVNERQIGTTYDNNAETRRIRMERAPGGIDLAHLTYRLDLEYRDELKDTCSLDKELDGDGIILTWTVPASCVAEPGTVWIAVRGIDGNGTVKWASNKGAVYVHDTVNTPGTYTGSLTELEQLEANIGQKMETLDEAEQTRQQQEKTRQQQEKTRQQQEQARQTESQRAVTAADNAAGRATQAAVDVEAATARANKAAGTAESATDAANKAAGSVNASKEAALRAAETANTAAEGADSAAAGAELSAGLADASASRADTACQNAQAAAEAASETRQDLLDRLAAGEFKGEKGDKGDKGDKGESGLLAPSAGMFSLWLDPETGDLYADYPDGETAPAFQYDQETGNLYYLTGEDANG